MFYPQGFDVTWTILLILALYTPFAFLYLMTRRIIDACVEQTHPSYFKEMASEKDPISHDKFEPLETSEGV